MKARVLIGVALASAVASGSGCSQRPTTAYESSAQVAKLDPKFRDVIRKVLAEECGGPTAPKLLGSPKLDPAVLRHGAEVYMRNCRQCHGVSGDGAGPAADAMNPRPRDYRAGVFKFTSTTYGSKPLREDLLRTIRRGVAGTSMPSFDLLPPSELEAVVDYVLALTHRGELETQLAEAAEFDGEVNPREVPRMVEGVLAKWNAARTQVVYPISPMPEFTSANVKAGMAAFATQGCSKCHGDDGRGQTKDNIGTDLWGHPTKAADLTSGMLRGGTEALDIYRHVSAGINGTPMPSFVGFLQKEPETMWNLTAFVLYLSNQRRNGAMPEAGLLKPLPGVESKVPETPAKTAVRPAVDEPPHAE